MKAGLLAERQVCSLSPHTAQPLAFLRHQPQAAPGNAWSVLGVVPSVGGGGVGREMVAKYGCHGNVVAAASAADEGHLSACRLRSVLPRPGAKTEFLCSRLLA